MPETNLDFLGHIGQLAPQGAHLRNGEYGGHRYCWAGIGWMAGWLAPPKLAPQTALVDFVDEAEVE